MIDYIKLLKELKLWPMENWESFEFLNQKPIDKTEEVKQLDNLKSEVSNRSGIYVYKRLDQWLYVGKANPLYNRLKSHYCESFMQLKGDHKDHSWHNFFSENAGQVFIYWKEIKKEIDRRVFELALKEILDPTFDKYRQKYKQEKKMIECKK